VKYSCTGLFFLYPSERNGRVRHKAKYILQREFYIWWTYRAVLIEELAGTNNSKAVVPATVVPSLANYIKTMFLRFLLKHSHQHILSKVLGIFTEAGQEIQSLSWEVARQSRDPTFQNMSK